MGKATRLRSKMKAVARQWSTWTSVPVTAELREKHPHLKNCSAIWANSRYEVQVFNCSSEIGGIVQLCITRHGDIEKITWDELERVKNELYGENSVAVEVYPPQDCSWAVKREIRVLWVLPESFILPFGLHLPTAFGGRE